MQRAGWWLMAGSLGLLGAAVLAAAAVCLGSGCSTVGYYAQAAGGHLEILSKAQPVKDIVDDPATPEPLRERLKLSQRLRDFAISELQLPDNGSYRRYADLQRDAVVWNVVAAPALALQLKTWCYPLMGCAGYRGYFAKPEAEALATQLKAEGWETMVYGVPAYSTLGWTNWLGGDPLLNTFLNGPEIDLARLIFHELAHQVAYAPDDTTFNESFATAVERIGGRRWLARQGDAAQAARVDALDRRRAEFRALTQRTRQALEAVYTGPGDEASKTAAKARVMAQLRAELDTLKQGPWQGFTGYDGWVARANNASFGVLAAYNELVPQFEALFEREGSDFTRFFARVKALAALPKEERRRQLAALAP